MQNIIQSARSILTTTATRWTELAAQVPADLLDLPPAQGEWSARQCLQHLVDTEAVFFFRLGAFLRGDEAFPAFNPDEQGSLAELSAAELAAEFERQRQTSLEALDRLQPADLARKSRHQELGPVTLEEFLNEWAGHDLNHTVQAERALMQPFIRSCGPWQVYFKDQVIEAR